MATHHWELLGELRQQITELENAISRINSVKRNLQANSAEVKSQVHAAISRQLEALRSREVWLLNQVETLQHAKEDILHGQQTLLSEALGEARNSADHVEGCLRGDQEENCDAACIERVLAENLKKMKDLNLEPEESSCLGFSADSGSLRESIHRFGRVDRKNPRPEDLVFSTAGLKAASLPSPFEEYGDQEHHVLYKTVEDARRQQGQEMVYQVPHPDLRKEDWLAHGPITTQPQRSTPGHVTSSEQDGPPPHPRFGSLGKINISTAPMCIQDWLLQIRHEDGNESHGSTMEGDSDFVMLDGKFSRAHSETSESVEMIGSPDLHAMLEQSDWLKKDDQTSNTPYTEFPYFEEIKQMKDWILKYEEGAKCSPCCYVDQVSGAVEIESLGQLSCMKGSVHKYFHDIPANKDYWLLKSSKDVQSLCRANEVCSSFSNCVCDQNCQQQTAYDPERVGQHFKLISNKVTDWLLQPKSPSLQKELDESPIFTYFRTVISDPAYWLAAGAPSVAPEPLTPTPFDAAFAAASAQPCGYWLAHRAESKEVNNTQCPHNLTTQEFSFFHDEGMKHWLLPGEGKEEDSTPTQLQAFVVNGFMEIESQPMGIWLAEKCPKSHPEVASKPGGQDKVVDAEQIVLEGLQQFMNQPKEAWLARPAVEYGDHVDHLLAETADKQTESSVEEELGYDPGNAAVQMALGGLDQFMTLNKEEWLDKGGANSTEVKDGAEQPGYSPDNPVVLKVLGGLKQFESLGKEAWLDKGGAKSTQVKDGAEDKSEEKPGYSPDNPVVLKVLGGLKQFESLGKNAWLDKGGAKPAEVKSAMTTNTQSKTEEDVGSSFSSPVVQRLLGGLQQFQPLGKEAALDMMKAALTTDTKLNKGNRSTKLEELTKEVEEKVQDSYDPENQMVKVVLQGLDRICARGKEEWLDRGDGGAVKKSEAESPDKSSWLLQEKEGSSEPQSGAVQYVLGGLSQIYSMDNKNWLDRSGDQQEPVVKNAWMWRRDQDLAQWLAKPASK